MNEVTEEGPSEAVEAPQEAPRQGFAITGPGDIFRLVAALFPGFAQRVEEATVTGLEPPTVEIRLREGENPDGFTLIIR